MAREITVYVTVDGDRIQLEHTGRPILNAGDVLTIVNKNTQESKDFFIVDSGFSKKADATEVLMTTDPDSIDVSDLATLFAMGEMADTIENMYEQDDQEEE